MKTSTRLLIVVAAGLALGYGSLAALRAHRNLVTLDVQGMDVRQVVKKLQWQTWETIVVHSNVQGKVTLRVRKVPLEEALRIVGEQTYSSPEVLYPIYARGSALTSLKKALRGEVDPARYGWTNLLARGFFMRGPGGPGRPLGQPGPADNALVSLDLRNKDLNFASLALARFAGARIVPEDTAASLPVNLTLEKATVDEAVSKLAKQARRSYARLFTLRGDMGFGRGPGGPGQPGGMPGPGSPPMMAGPGQQRPAGPGGPGGPGFDPQALEQMFRQRQEQEAQLLSALPAAERQRLEQERLERERAFQEMQNLTPEQRQQRMAAAGGMGAMMDQRNRDRVRHSTSEQRAEQARRMIAMRRAMGAMGAGQFPGGPMGPGGPGASARPPAPPPGR